MTDIIETVEPPTDGHHVAGDQPANPVTTAPLLMFGGDDELVCVDETCVPVLGADGSARRPE